MYWEKKYMYILVIQVENIEKLLFLLYITVCEPTLLKILLV